MPLWHAHQISLQIGAVLNSAAEVRAGRRHRAVLTGRRSRPAARDVFRSGMSSRYSALSSETLAASTASAAEVRKLGRNQVAQNGVEERGDRSRKSRSQQDLDESCGAVILLDGKASHLSLTIETSEFVVSIWPIRAKVLQQKMRLSTTGDKLQAVMQVTQSCACEITEQVRL